MLILNGNSIAFFGTETLTGFLKSQGFSLDRVAVELNGTIVKKADYASCMVQENDVLEVVSFVGGG